MQIERDLASVADSSPQESPSPAGVHQSFSDSLITEEERKAEARQARAEWRDTMTLDAAERARRVRLFENRSDDFLAVSINIPITTCNYRCNYCFLNHEVKPDLTKLEKLPAIIDRLARIPRPLGVTLGPWGEILAVPKMWPLLGQAARLPNVVHVETWTNLSRDPELLFEHIDPKKLCIIGTYHPTEFKSFEADNETFFARVTRIKDLVRDISINFVICEENLPFVEQARQRFAELGVYFTVNPQINSQNGYGVKIRPVTRDEKTLTREMLDNEFLDFFFTQNRKANVRCTTGRDMIDVNWEGNVTRCEHLSQTTDPAELLGNILDPEGPFIDVVSRYCNGLGCACKSTIGYAEPFVEKYKRFGTQHKFHRRAPGEVGTHSYDPVTLGGANSG